MENGTKRPKKKFRYYDSYISKLLKTINPSNGITSDAKQQLNSVLIILSEIISDKAIQLTRTAAKKTISTREIEGAVQIVLNGELRENAIDQAKQSLQRMESGEANAKKGNSRQEKAGIIFVISFVLDRNFIRLILRREDI